MRRKRCNEDNKNWKLTKMRCLKDSLNNNNLERMKLEPRKQRWKLLEKRSSKSLRMKKREEELKKNTLKI